MSDWIKAANPFAAIDNQAAALAAARVSAVGIVLGAIRDSVQAWYAATGGTESAQRAMQELTGREVPVEQLEAAAQFGLMGTCAVVVLQLILAGVQWMKPNQTLPILFVVLVVWGLGGLLMTVVGMAQMEAMGMTPPPVWLLATSVLLLVPALILHISGIRGASALAKFRDAQAY